MNSSVTFRLRMELTGASQPSSAEVEKINRLLQEVSSKLKLTPDKKLLKGPLYVKMCGTSENPASKYRRMIQVQAQIWEPGQ